MSGYAPGVKVQEVLLPGLALAGVDDTPEWLPVTYVILPYMSVVWGTVPTASGAHLTLIRRHSRSHHHPRSSSSSAHGGAPTN